MPNAKKSGVLHKKYGPLTTIGWLGVGGGIGAAILGYKWYEAREANAAIAAQTAAAPSSEYPIDTGEGSGSTSATTTSTAGTYANLQSWLAALVDSGASGLSGAELYNGGLAWANGNCVSQAAYTALSGVIGTIGAPPGITAPLNVCAASKPPTTTTPPPASTSPGANPKIGSGYGSALAGFIHLSPQQAAWFQQHGLGFFYQPVIGEAESTKGVKLAGATPLYGSQAEINEMLAAQKASPAPK